MSPQEVFSHAWYESLSKPGWTPAPAIFTGVWGVLYPLILITHGFVFYEALEGKIPKKITRPFIINLITNFLFPVFFFGLKSVPLATLDILVVFASLLWSMVAIWPYYRWVAYLQIPYLLWIILATTIQLEVFIFNR